MTKNGMLKQALPWIVVLAVVCVFPVFVEQYWLFIGAQVFVYGIATLGLDILFGRTGQLSLAHASFFGIGAYVAAVGVQLGIGPMIQLPCVVIIGLLAALLIAVPTLRLSGLRLALVTLLFGELFIWIIEHAAVTGGTEGISIPPLYVFGSLSMSIPVVAYFATFGLAVVATLLVIQLGRTQLGKRMLAVRDSELAASSVGIDIVRTKVVAFLLAGVYAGIGGWLYAYVVGFVSPPTFDLFPSVYFLVAVILGGAGTIVGPWLGAAYIVLIPQVFSLLGVPNLFPFVGGVILVIVALALPNGLVGGVRDLAGLLRRRTEHEGKGLEA
jgi:branched-chain amino acid transport system permease protein